MSLLGVALGVERTPGPGSIASTVLLLGSLLAAYGATRLVALPPLRTPEPVDALGVLTQLTEAAGLVPALRLFHTAMGVAARCPPSEKELAHE